MCQTSRCWHLTNQELLQFLCTWLLLQENCLNKFPSVPVSQPQMQAWLASYWNHRDEGSQETMCPGVSIPWSYQAIVYSTFNRPDVETSFCEAWVMASLPVPLRPSYLAASKLNIPCRLGVFLFVSLSLTQVLPFSRVQFLSIAYTSGNRVNMFLSCTSQVIFTFSFPEAIKTHVHRLWKYACSISQGCQASVD